MVRDIPLSLVVSFGCFFRLFVLHWRYELPCQDKLPEFHYTPVLGCIRVLWLVFHPLGLELDKALFGWNSVNKSKTEFESNIENGEQNIVHYLYENTPENSTSSNEDDPSLDSQEFHPDQDLEPPMDDLLDL